MTSRDDDATGTGMTAVSVRALAHVIDRHPELVEWELAWLTVGELDLLTNGMDRLAAAVRLERVRRDGPAVRMT